ncbi:MAG: Ig-like domain-containing protein, partial [Solirubrobacteraceae bacterium]|nr:Ig-like domain-containing protein [Solirubrobacteraceae bacterium]
MVPLVPARRPNMLLALLVAVLAIVGSGFVAERASAAFPPCWKCEVAPEAPKPPVPDTEIVKAPPALTTDPKPDYSFRIPNGNPEILQIFVCSRVHDEQELWNPDIQFDCPTQPSNMGSEVHFPYGDGYGDDMYYMRVMGCAMTWRSATACDPSPALVSFRIDRTGPTLAFDAGAPAADAHLATNKFVVAWHAAEAGITDYTCVTDSDAPFPNCGTASQFTWTGEGSHMLKVTAKDALGNTGPVLTRTWVVDTIKPVSAMGATPPALTNNRRPAVAYSATDADTSLTATCTLKGPAGTTTPGCGPTSWVPATNLADGAYTFSVRHTDRAGNVSNAVQTTFTVDGTAPQVSAVSWDERTGRFTFTAGPGGTVTCSLDGGAFVPCVSPIDGSALEPGSHELVVQSIDTAGNRTERRLTI